MNLGDKLEISANVVAREVGGETMLLDLASGTYFGLDMVGSRVWQALENGGSLADTCDLVVQEYDVGRADLESDVLALATQLLEQGLISTC